MNFQQIECFVTVSQTLNFSVAATRLHLSQPAVSKNIKQLETELDIELFKRNQHDVSLTLAGVEFAKQMTNVLILTEQAIIDSHEISDQENQSLTVGYTNAILENKLLPLLLKNTQYKLPNVHLAIRQFELSTGISDLQRGIFDFILATRDTIGNNNPQIEFISLLQGHFNVILPIDHQLSNRDLLNFSDLTNSPLIFFNPRQAPPESATLQNKFLQVPGTLRYQTADTINTAINLVKGGVGLALLPSFTVDAKESGVAVIPLDYPVKLDYGAAYLRNNNSANVLRVIEFIKTLIASI